MPHYIIHYTSYAEVDAEDEDAALCIDTDQQVLENVEVQSIEQDD